MAQATARPAIFQTRFKTHPSLRYKTVQALKHKDPPIKEISTTMRIRITLQEFDN